MKRKILVESTKEESTYSIHDTDDYFRAKRSECELRKYSI